MIREVRRRGCSVALIIALGVSLSACAAGARSTQMVVGPADAPAVSAGQRGYKEFRVVTVQGGSKTNPMWMSNVDSAQFQGALEASLRQSNYLADDPAQAKGEIKATMSKLDRPLAGLDLTVASTVDYKATLGEAVVMEDKVAATGVGRFSDHLIAVERLRIANEAAVRENIEEFIRRLNTALKGG